MYVVYVCVLRCGVLRLEAAPVEDAVMSALGSRGLGGPSHTYPAHWASWVLENQVKSSEMTRIMTMTMLSM